MATFDIQGKVVDKLAGLSIPYAKIKVYEVDKVPPTGFKSDLLVQGTSALDGTFHITFSWGSTNRPDIIFQVSQRIEGVDKVIYDENPALHTRWNIGDYLSVTLETTGGQAINPPETDRGYDNLFVFTRVGVIGVNDIDTVGATASGYAHPDTNAAAPNSMDANAPFGATLDVCGWFGHFTNLARYKLQCSRDGVNFDDVTDPLVNYYFELDASGGHWVGMSMGPSSEGGQDNLYKLPYIEQPGRPWIYPDLLGKWNTSKSLDGLHTLRIKGYKWVAGVLQEVTAADLVINPNYGTLKLRIDNTPPVAKLLDMFKDASTVQVCDIVDFASGTLAIEFEASDANGHLRDYTLHAMYGHNKVVTPYPARAVDDYSKHIDASHQWKGGVFKRPPHAATELDAVEYSATSYPKTKMPTCAYQFRLDVSKRTTNGYGLVFHDLEDTKHITIKRP